MDIVVLFISVKKTLNRKKSKIGNMFLLIIEDFSVSICSHALGQNIMVAGVHWSVWSLP